jgi:uncharacterized protein
MLTIPTRLQNSSLHGIGVFATEPVAQGTLVWTFHPGFDIEWDEAEVAKLPPVAQRFLKMHAYRALETGRLTLNTDYAKHMNHSDTPNLVSDAASNYYAARDIAAGEELLCDYRAFVAEGWIDDMPDLHCKAE